MDISKNLNVPDLDRAVPDALETATLSMGCFWGPEALYGAQEGVYRTRVGYAGGTSKAPSYRQIGDHIETLQIDFDPGIIGFEQLLDLFFQHHNTSREPWKRQYASALFYHSPEQEVAIRKKIGDVEAQEGKKVQTHVYGLEVFYLAEDRHQKYKLQRHPLLLAEFRKIYPKPQDFIDSTAVCKANGYLGYNPGLEKVLEQLGSFGLSEQGQQVFLKAVAVGSSAFSC